MLNTTIDNQNTDLSPINDNLSTIGNENVISGAKERKRAVSSKVLSKGRLIAKEVLKGRTFGQAIKKAGYNTQSNTTHIINYTHAKDYLLEFASKKASEVLENLSNSSNCEPENLQLHRAIQEGDWHAVQAISKALAVRSKIGQDLLDRAGISKINKHLTIKKDITSISNISDIDTRLLELENKLKNRGVNRLNESEGLSNVPPSVLTGRSVETVKSTNDLSTKSKGLFCDTEGKGENVGDNRLKTEESLGKDEEGVEKGEDGEGVGNIGTIHSDTHPYFLGSKSGVVHEMDREEFHAM